MFATGLIVFRESLEAALFVGIMAAATRLLPRRSWWIALGVLAGIVGSVLIALSIGAINSIADGAGQDWLAIIILAVAFFMLTWHVVWSNSHGRELAQKAKSLGQSAGAGQKTLGAVAIAISLIVLREGAETVLFVSGSLNSAAVLAVPTTPIALPVLETSAIAVAKTELPTTLDLTAAVKENKHDDNHLAPSQPLALPNTLDLTQGHSTSETAPNATTTAALPPPNDAPPPSNSWREVAMGGAIGLLLGALAGVLTYFGLSKMSIGQMFRITNLLVVVLAAGMAGQLGNRLVQMGILNVGTETLWDWSKWLGNDSAVGVFLHALMGYEAQPTLIHVAFFVMGILLIVGLTRWVKGHQLGKKSSLA